MDSYLYHAANFEPEVARLARAYATNDLTKVALFKQKTLDIVDRILSSPDISPAGKEEWGVVSRLVNMFESNDASINNLLSTYGTPFSMRFALSR
jgi:hypothetical protein